MAIVSVWQPQRLSADQSARGDNVHRSQLDHCIHFIIYVTAAGRKQKCTQSLGRSCNMRVSPSKHRTLPMCWFNVGPTSQNQHMVNVPCLLPFVLQFLVNRINSLLEKEEVTAVCLCIAVMLLIAFLCYELHYIYTFYILEMIIFIIIYIR